MFDHVIEVPQWRSPEIYRLPTAEVTSSRPNNSEHQSKSSDNSPKTSGIWWKSSEDFLTLFCKELQIFRKVFGRSIDNFQIA